jgi:hypothetical protein
MTWGSRHGTRVLTHPHFLSQTEQGFQSAARGIRPTWPSQCLKDLWACSKARWLIGLPAIQIYIYICIHIYIALYNWHILCITDLFYVLLTYSPYWWVSFTELFSVDSWVDAILESSGRNRWLREGSWWITSRIAAGAGNATARSGSGTLW